MGRAGPPPPPLPDPSSSNPHHKPHSIPSSFSHFLSSDLTSTSVPASDLASSSGLALDLGAATSSASQSSSDLQPSRRRSSSSTRSSGLAAFSSRSSFLSAVPVLDLVAAGPPAGPTSSVHLLPHQSASSLSRSSGVAAVSPSSSSPAAARAQELAPAGSTAILPSSDQLLVADPSRSELPLCPSHQHQPALQQVAAPRSGTSVPKSGISVPPRTVRNLRKESLAAAATSSGVQAPSYANIVRDPTGPSFIRAHTKSVESFGAIPDISAAPKIALFGGEPSVQFSEEELRAAENIFSDAIVMKFLSGRPSWDVCFSTIKSWGLKQEFVLGPLDSRSILLRFRNHIDMMTVLAREANYINGFPYRAYRWNRLYNVKEDAAFAPVWVSLPRLPIPFYVPSMLKGIANSIGNFLCFDRATSLMTRASSARFCIEVDLRKKPPTHVWIGVHGKFRQPIIYERLPKFCNFCKIQGHEVEICKKTPIDKSNPINHGVYEPLVHNGNAYPIPSPSKAPPNSVLVPDPQLRLSAHGDITNSNLNHQLIGSDLNHQVHRPSSPSLVSVPVPPKQGEALGAHAKVQASVSQPTDHNLAENSDGSLLAGVVLDDTNACMTDLLNQQPPLPNVEIIQAEKPPCPPGVCDNADTTDKTKSVDPDSFNLRDKALSVHPTPATESQQMSVQHQLVTGTTSDRLYAEVDNLATSDPMVAGNSSAIAPIQHRTSADQSTKLKQLVVPQQSSLFPNQSAALERLKRKVGNLARLQSQQPIGIPSVNPFDALQDVQSDDDDGSDSVASYHSDSDGGFVEPLNMGYQSGDDRPSSICKISSSAHTGKKINKRHPNIPLNVRLRARKSSFPSTP